MKPRICKYHIPNGNYFLLGDNYQWCLIVRNRYVYPMGEWKFAISAMNSIIRGEFSYNHYWGIDLANLCPIGTIYNR